MALTATTLASACSASATSIVVASATSIAAGSIVQIDGERMLVGKGYVLASTTVPVLRGQDGGAAIAHPVTAAVYHGVASDFGAQTPQTTSGLPIAGIGRLIRSYSATGAITLPDPGGDAFAILNAVGSAVLAMTVAAPTKDMDGCRLTIASQNGTGAHTITVSGGINGAGGSYDVFTFPAGPVMIELTALDSVWYTSAHPAWTGTVTLLTGGIA